MGPVEGTGEGGSKIPSWIDEMDPEEALRYQKYWDEASKRQGLTQKEYTELLEDAYYARRNSGLTEPSLPKGSKPYGNYADGDAYGITKQNETANTLANQGYEVRMLDEIDGGNGFGVTPNKNPDFLIENKVFDCYAPKPNANVRNIINEIKNKTKEQAQRIILNLDGFSTEKVDEIIETIIRKANPNGDLKNLSELIIVKDEKIIRVYGGR